MTVIKRQRSDNFAVIPNEVANDARGRDLPGHIYAVRAQHGGIKIGSSTDVARRLVGLKRGRSLSLVVLASFAVRDRDQAEQAAQRLLRKWHLSGEWFSCTDADAIDALRRSAEAWR